MRILIFILPIFLFSCNSKSNNSPGEVSEANQSTLYNSEIQTGDLIFHTSNSSQSKAIQIATNSKYSHMGVVFQEGDELFVFEAIQPVKLTRFDDWINRGENGNYVIKRLENSEELITGEGMDKLKLEGEKYLGKDYDLLFEWSNDKIYCSELVWKIYKDALNIEIGALQKFGDFDLSDNVVDELVNQRYGDELPLDELVITPDRMFNAENLITIVSK